MGEQENYGGCISQIRIVNGVVADVIELEDGTRVCDYCGTAVRDNEYCPGCGSLLDYRDLNVED